MAVKKDVKKGIREVRIEVKVLGKELKILEKLKKGKKEAIVSIRETGGLLAASHNLNEDVLGKLVELEVVFPHRTDEIEEIRKAVKKTEGVIENVLSPRGGSLWKVVSGHTDMSEVKGDIDNVEEAIKTLLQQLKLVNTEFKTVKKDYKKSEFQKKMVYLLHGIGYYKKYSLNKRREMWNRFVRVTPIRVLKNVNLSGADLSGFNFSGFIFKNLIGKGVDLRYAYFIGANLEAADLRNADLRGATLIRADLRNANLRNADLSGANLCEADFRFVKICPLDKEELKKRKAIV